MWHEKRRIIDTYLTPDLSVDDVTLDLFGCSSINTELDQSKNEKNKKDLSHSKTSCQRRSQTTNHDDTSSLKSKVVSAMKKESFDIMKDHVNQIYNLKRLAEDRRVQIEYLEEHVIQLENEIDQLQSELKETEQLTSEDVLTETQNNNQAEHFRMEIEKLRVQLREVQYENTVTSKQNHILEESRNQIEKSRHEMQVKMKQEIYLLKQSNTALGARVTTCQNENDRLQTLIDQFKKEKETWNTFMENNEILKTKTVEQQGALEASEKEITELRKQTQRYTKQFEELEELRKRYSQLTKELLHAREIIRELETTTMNSEERLNEEIKRCGELQDLYDIAQNRIQKKELYETSFESTTSELDACKQQLRTLENHLTDKSQQSHTLAHELEIEKAARIQVSKRLDTYTDSIQRVHHKIIAIYDLSARFPQSWDYPMIFDPIVRTLDALHRIHRNRAEELSEAKIKLEANETERRHLLTESERNQSVIDQITHDNHELHDLLTQYKQRAQHLEETLKRQENDMRMLQQKSESKEEMHTRTINTVRNRLLATKISQTSNPDDMKAHWAEVSVEDLADHVRILLENAKTSIQAPSPQSSTGFAATAATGIVFCSNVVQQLCENVVQLLRQQRALVNYNHFMEKQIHQSISCLGTAEKLICKYREALRKKSPYLPSELQHPRRYTLRNAALVIIAVNRLRRLASARHTRGSRYALNYEGCGIRLLPVQESPSDGTSNSGLFKTIQDIVEDRYFTDAEKLSVMLRAVNLKTQSKSWGVCDYSSVPIQQASRSGREIQAYEEYFRKLCGEAFNKERQPGLVADVEDVEYYRYNKEEDDEVDPDGIRERLLEERRTAEYELEKAIKTLEKSC